MKNLPRKTRTALLLIGVVSCALSVHQASAQAITGQLDMGGNATLNTNDLSTATAVDTWNAATTTSFPHGTGSFSGINFGTPVTLSAPWTFGLTSGGPQPALWTVGGFTFDLTSDVVDQRSSTLLDVVGTGFLSGNGFDSTPGQWEFTINNASGNPHANFSFTASSAAIPEPGSLALISVGAITVLAFGRKLGQTQGLPR
jgi:hypothetical protein